MDRNERIDLATSRLTTGMLKGKGLPVRDDLWPSVICVTNGSDVHRPFGYTAPQYLPYDERWAFFFNAAAVADSTSELDDDEFDVWLSYILAHLNLHAAHADEHDIEERVEADLREMGPEASRVRDRVYEGMFA